MFKRKLNGLTMLELVVALLVLGFLVLVTYANQKKQLHFNNVAMVKAHLLDISNRQNEYLLQHKVYAKDLKQLGMVKSKILASHYKVVIADVDNTASSMGYMVKAIPITESGDTFTLNHLGQTSENWGR